jgi:hypothetical protein
VDLGIVKKYQCSILSLRCSKRALKTTESYVIELRK